VIPVTGASGSPDYFQRHPELKAPAGVAVEMNGDFALRHPEWASREQNVAIPVTGISESLDYYQRHPELSSPAAITVDMTDYFARHPELRTPTESNDLSDYFLRH
jgi:6-phosphogluconate dehydrogenase